MLRVQMVISQDSDDLEVFDWFVHRVKMRWFVTFSERADRIRSISIDLSTNPMDSPAIAVAQLWNSVWTEQAYPTNRCSKPSFFQSEIRVMSPQKRYWVQASTWIWQDERVIAYRSHPDIQHKASPVRLGPIDSMTQQCFDVAAELESEFL
ncbi:hypothetical protein [Caballeronia sp. LZ028]|uniref:hypothetical protein n=1 Tax=Caballeronia sp. LZ028 TaxID=3038563 RepID=UPI0028655E5D|nr:hypothetical protein [Caballeronia sp. LZ028]MDR5770115.1 hypothetical protein [Caballeronia sp. LZ028]